MSDETTDPSTSGIEQLVCDVNDCDKPALVRVYPTHGQTDHDALRCRKCLSYDLDRHWFREWGDKIADRHSRSLHADTKQSNILRELHDRYTSLEHAVEEAIQDLRLGRNSGDVAAELETALENKTDPSSTDTDRREVSDRP